MTILHLTPAYGRDYSSKKAVIEAFHKNHDFIIRSFDMPAQPVDKFTLNNMGIVTVNVRYMRNTRVAVIKVASKAPKPTVKRSSKPCKPSDGQLNVWMRDGLGDTVDGCTDIELDGHCEHGSPSWFLELGLI